MDEKLKKIFTGKFTKSEKKLQKDLESIKIPYIYKDAVLFSPGTWNEILFTKEVINASVDNMDWNKKNSSLYLDHNDSVHDWVGDVQSIKVQPDGKVIGDLHIVNKEIAQQIEYGAEWGISPTIQIIDAAEDGQMTMFENVSFSFVIEPAMATNYINEGKEEYSKEEKKMNDSDLSAIKKETEIELAKMSIPAPAAATGTDKISLSEMSSAPPQEVSADNAVLDLAKKSAEKQVDDLKAKETIGEGKDDEDEDEEKKKKKVNDTIDDNQVLSKSRLEQIGLKLHKISEMKEAINFKKELESAVRDILEVADLTLSFNKKQEELAVTIKEMEMMAAKLSDKVELIKEKDKMVATYQSKLAELNKTVAMYKERDTLREQEKKIAKFSKVLSNYCKFHGYQSTYQQEEAKARLSTLSEEALELIGRDVSIGLSDSEVVTPKNSAQLSQTIVAPTVGEPSQENKMKSLFEKFSRAPEEIK